MDNWRGIIRGLLYATIFEREPANALQRVLDQVIAKDLRNINRRKEYIEAIQAALQSSDDLSQLNNQSQSDESLRHFLRLLAEHLAA